MHGTASPYAGEKKIERNKYVRPIIVAVSFTLCAEIFYLVIWGVWWFPDGLLLPKLVWTITCGIAMGSVAASLTIVFVIDRLTGGQAVFSSACFLFAVGSYCAVLCSRIDTVMNYFGGMTHSQLFVLGGIIPAAVGGLAYGCILHTEYGQKILARCGV